MYLEINICVFLLWLADISALVIPTSRHLSRFKVSNLALLPPSQSSCDVSCACSLAHTSEIYENSFPSSKSTAEANESLFPFPDSLRKMGAPAQAMIVLVYYTLHVVVFPHYEYVLDPLNDFIFGLFDHDVGFCLDDIVGLMVLLCTWMYHKVNNLAIPRLFNVSEKNAPWGEVTLSPHQGFGVVLSIFGLYYWSGTLYPAFHTMSNLLALVLPLTVPIQRNLEVFLLHMAWVAPSVALLKKVDHFFPRQGQESESADGEGEGNNLGSKTSRGDGSDTGVARRGANLWGTRRGKSAWWASSGNANWAWWVIGGYAASVLVFRVASAVNGLILPVSWAADQEHNVVSRMVSHPGEGPARAGVGAPSSSPGLGLGKLPDSVALLVGAVAPCLSAPWWEELFYRGFIYPWLASFLPMLLATPGSAVIFAAHHAQRDALLPLAAMGLVWALLYLASGNLLVVMLVHAMWNSKIFLNGLLSLLYT